MELGKAAMWFFARSVLRLGLLALFIPAAGCASKHHYPAYRPTHCVCVPKSASGGYYSTCWRQWPSECGTCPPLIEPGEAPPQVPQPAEALPPAVPSPSSPSSPPDGGSPGFQDELLPPRQNSPPDEPAAPATGQRAGGPDHHTSAARHEPPRPQAVFSAFQPDKTVVVRGAAAKAR
jgi:hypothetical protein